MFMFPFLFLFQALNSQVLSPLLPPKTRNPVPLPMPYHPPRGDYIHLVYFLELTLIAFTSGLHLIIFGI